MARSYYQILAVSPDATTEEIERSFRQLARRLHPDLNGGDGATVEMMKELNLARAALTDATARAAYDAQLRQEPRRGQPSGSPRQPPQASGDPGGRSRFEPRPAGAPGAGPRPFLSWARPRTASPPPPTRELRPASHIWRILWIGLGTLVALFVVILLIWLRGALAE